jgi:hypothetical protein
MICIIYLNNYLKKKQGSASVKIGMSNCSITSINDNTIVCNLGVSGAGLNDVIVHIANQGISNNDIKYTYSLSISSLSTSTGMLFRNK